MRVKCVVAFVAMVGNDLRSFAEGDEVELPAGVDWLTAGLVVALEPAPTEPPTPKSVTKKKVTGDGK